ncbi:MAG: hypothetical protein WBH31_11715 [Promethearchaeia archaeon]
MSLIAITLLIMLVLTILSILTGTDFISHIIDIEYSGIVDIDDVPALFEIESVSQDFYVDPLLGALVILTSIVVIAGVIGIQILGSGISESGHRTITICIIYAGIWTMLSVLASPLIFGITQFGGFIYVVITILYVIGVIKMIGGGGM